MASMSSYIALTFVAVQFINFFGYTKPGTIIALKGTEFFKNSGIGTRCENLILCVEDEKNEYGQFLRFEYLTWAPIDLDATDTKYMDEKDVERLNSYHAEVYKRIAPHLTQEERIWLRYVTRPISR